MRECGVVAAIVALSVASHMAQLPYGLKDAWSFTGLAFVLSVVGSMVSGIGYHRALWGTLGRRRALPKGWWWSPVQYHRFLGPKERLAVMPWFCVGAASFVAVILSAAAVLGLALR